MLSESGCLQATPARRHTIVQDHESTSRSLLTRARANDAAAWDRLVSLYAPFVSYWCRRCNAREQDVADIFQEVFRAVAANLARFQKKDAGHTFRGWLRVITRNKVYDHYRKSTREPRAIGGTEVQIQLSQIPTPQADLEETDADRAAGAGLFHRALGQVRDRFEPRTWEAFWRTAVDGLPAGDVAEDLSMSPGAVRVAKSRVLQRLREELGELIE
ncbi:MAG: sigma-70 family RNA polymerase sigma factor [Planctomycetota bacterium]|nr:sigma-70 family RNA polymerase sigma factor [Planctomycetota bacterium]